MWGGNTASEAFNLKSTITPAKHVSGSIMWWCFAIKGTGTQQKVDGIMQNENYDGVFMNLLI